MADIDVVQKRSGARVWFWVILAIAALVILFLLMMGADTTVTEEPINPVSHLTAAAAAWQT